MIKEKLQKLCEKKKKTLSQQTPTKQENLSSFLGQHPLLTASALQQELCAVTAQSLNQKLLLSVQKLLPNPEWIQDWALLMFVQQEREQRNIEFMLGTVSATLKPFKYISFYPFTNLPLPEPSLSLGIHSLSLVVCVQI